MRVFHRILPAFTFALLLVLAPAPNFAKQLEGTIPREQHPWAQFKIGSWKRVKTTTETLDAKGAVVSTSITETTTKLVDADDEGYTLRIDAVVEVAGKKFPAQPQVIRRGYNGETDGQSVSVKRVGDAGLFINGSKVACEVRQITVNGDEGKRVTTVHYSQRIAPYVLRRETTAVDTAGKPTDVTSQVDVVAVEMPYKVLGEQKTCSTVRVVHQQGKASTLTLEFHCPEIPGAVVSHTSKETDDAGRVIRRSTLELLEYELGTGEDADAKTVRQAFHRRAARRAR